MRVAIYERNTKSEDYNVLKKEFDRIGIGYVTIVDPKAIDKLANELNVLEPIVLIDGKYKSLDDIIGMIN